MNLEPLPLDRLERDGSADGTQAGDDDIHPHAAPRDVCNFPRGGKTGHEYEAINLLVAQARNRFRGAEAALNCLFPDAIPVQPAPVVGDLNVDLAGLVIGGNRYFSGFGLALGEAFPRSFDAMIRAIPDQVHERIANCFDQLPVEFGIGALDDEIVLLLEFDGEFANQPGNACKQAAHRLHARPHDRVLQVGCDR